MNSKITIKKMFLKNGELTQGFPLSMALSVFTECPIFHHRDFGEFFSAMTRFIETVDRYEYLMYSEDGILQASMAIYEENDVHVGRCMSVGTAFSQSGGDLSGGYRWLFQLAKEEGLKWVAYTRTLGNGELRLVYRKVK